MLVLAEAQLDAIYRHGEETFPHECCGLLLGTTDGAHDVRARHHTGNDNQRCSRYQVSRGFPTTSNQSIGHGQ